MSSCSRSHTIAEAIGGTVRNMPPSMHTHYQSVATSKRLRTLFLRLDIGNTKVLYTGTVQHIGYEFDQIPEVHVVYGNEKENVTAELISFGVSPTILSLHYRSQELKMDSSTSPIDMRQVIFNLHGQKGAKVTGIDKTIRDWMVKAPKDVVRSEKRECYLDESPVISVVRVHVPSEGGRSRSKVQTPIGTVVSEVIYEGNIHLQFGQFFEAVFKDSVSDRPMVKFLESRLVGSDVKFPIKTASAFNALIADFEGDDKPLTPLYLVHAGEKGAQVDAVAQLLTAEEASTSSTPISVGISSDDWERYDRMLNLYDQVRGVTPAPKEVARRSQTSVRKYLQTPKA